MNNRGWSPPYILILIVMIGILTLVFGWTVLIYVASLIVVIPICTWIYDITTHSTTCRECATARDYIKPKHPDWHMWTILR